MSAQIIPFPGRLNPEPEFAARMRGYAAMIRKCREEERAENAVELDPTFHGWFAEQDRQAAALGLPLPPFHELCERWLRGEHELPMPEKLELEPLVGALKEKLGLRVINTRGARRDKGKITPESYLQLGNAVSALAGHFRSQGRAEDAIFRLVRQRFDCRITELRENDFPKVMELVAEVRAVVEQLKQSQTMCYR